MENKLYYCLMIFSENPYKVVIPFVCQKCGNCCKKNGVLWSSEDIINVSNYLSMQLEDFISKHYKKILRDNPCPFLREDNLCKIYQVRPKACIAYPIATDCGTAGVNCLGYQRIKDLIEKLRRGNGFNLTWRPYNQLYMPDLYRPPFPNERQKIELYRRYLKTNPIKEEQDLFIKLNHLENFI